MKYITKINQKGFTIIEILTVLFLILTIFSITVQILKPIEYFKKSRDIKRIGDLATLNNALKTYLLVTTTPNLGPDNKAVDEINPTIFISIPIDKENITNQTLNWKNKTYYFHQVSSTDYFKNDGTGWLPVNIKSLIYPVLDYYPYDPINSYTQKLFYSYVFNRASSTFEINTRLEYSNYNLGGNEDYVSNDNGDNNNILEVGNDKTLMPNNLY